MHTNRLQGSSRFELIFQPVKARNVFPISFMMSFRILVTPMIAGVIRMIWTMVMVPWAVRMTRVVTIQIITILISYCVDFIVIPLLSLRRSSRWRRSCSSQSRFTPGVLDGVSTSFPRYRLPFDGGGNILFQKKIGKSSQLLDFACCPKYQFCIRSWVKNESLGTKDKTNHSFNKQHKAFQILQDGGFLRRAKDQATFNKHESTLHPVPWRVQFHRLERALPKVG